MNVYSNPILQRNLGKSVIAVSANVVGLILGYLEKLVEVQSSCLELRRRSPKVSSQGIALLSLAVEWPL